MESIDLPRSSDHEYSCEWYLNDPKNTIKSMYNCMRFYLNSSEDPRITKMISEAERIANDDRIWYAKKGSSDNEGYDCSGFVWHCLWHIGINLERFGTSSMLQYMPDSIFEHYYYTGKTMLKRGGILRYDGHTAIYLGKGGDEDIVDAADTADTKYGIYIHKFNNGNKGS